MNDISETQRRTQAYWFIDGIGEMVGGAALALVGALLVLAHTSGRDGYGTAALAVMILGFPVSAAVVRWWKDRVTHQRTGYVRFPEPSGKRRGLAAALGAVVSAVFVGVAAGRGGVDLTDALSRGALMAAGLVVAAAISWRAGRLHMPRFYVSAAAVVLAAWFAATRGLGFLGGMGVVWLVLGIVSAGTGAVAFAAYLRHNPPSEAGA